MPECRTADGPSASARSAAAPLMPDPPTGQSEAAVNQRRPCRQKSADFDRRSQVASALPHSEDIAYKPPCGEIAMCLRVGPSCEARYAPRSYPTSLVAVEQRVGARRRKSGELPYGQGRSTDCATAFLEDLSPVLQAATIKGTHEALPPRGRKGEFFVPICPGFTRWHQPPCERLAPIARYHFIET